MLISKTSSASFNIPKFNLSIEPLRVSIIAPLVSLSIASMLTWSVFSHPDRLFTRLQGYAWPFLHPDFFMATKTSSGILPLA